MAEEIQEKFVIVQPDTVADPRTMMVEARNALPADGAVMGPWWSYRLALGTVFPENDRDLDVCKHSHNF